MNFDNAIFLFDYKCRTEVFTKEWKKVDPSGKDFHYLHISGPGKYKMVSHDNLGDKKFWRTIDFEENVLESSASAKDEL